MSIIQVDHLTFGYDTSPDLIFQDLSIRLDTSWKLGLIARNGKGKTTFLRLLHGDMEYRGTISCQVPMEYFPPNIGDSSRDTMEILEELEPGCELWKICRECNMMGLDTQALFRPFSTLSSGERTKALLALLFSGEHAFLLIDEPTNHLDLDTRQVLGNYLKGKEGFLLVSHDRMLLDACVDHVLILNREEIELRQGNFTAWWEDKRNRDAFEQRENEKLRREIGRLTSASRDYGMWADQVESRKIGKSPLDSHFHIGTRAYLGEKSRKMQQRRKSLMKRREKAVEEKTKLLKNVEDDPPLKVLPLRHYKEILIQAKGCVFSYGGQPGTGSVDFVLRAGQKLFLRGPNGSGKSTVIKGILRELENQGTGNCPGETVQEYPGIRAGELTLAPNLIISYVPQDTSFLKGSLKEFIDHENLEESLFLAMLRKLDISREQFEKDMADYSAGQKKKVLLAKSLCQRAHVYIWDEPLNYVDVFSRIQIEEFLKNAPITLLAVEHDQAFCETVKGSYLTLE